MNVINWLTTRFSLRGKSLALYKRGMTKAAKQDHQGAIDDYTAAIAMPGIPTDVIAMVLYNRALVYVSSGDNCKGTDDLEAVLAMSEPLINIKTMARHKLARMESRANKSDT